jgi:hypothetical protein
MVLDFLIRIERGYPGDGATTTAANTHCSFKKKKRKKKKKETKKKKRKKRLWISLYVYISIYLSITRGCLKKVRKKEVVFMELSRIWARPTPQQETLHCGVVKKAKS